MKLLAIRPMHFQFAAVLLACAFAIPLAQAAEPVGITAIDARRGIVTAGPVNARTIQFKVTNAAQLRTLKVG
ncbi:MAG: hypothetical protein ACRES3_09755, partial [Steroidobacteraceae bacterium]